ncbi:hypothetical protein D3C84_964050 [compost metagenome]
MSQRNFVAHHRALAEPYQVDLARVGRVLGPSLVDEVQQHLAAGLQVRGVTVIGTLALFREPLITVLFHALRRPHREVVVIPGQLALEFEQVLFVAAGAVQEDHQRAVAGLLIGLGQVVERQVRVQRGLGLQPGRDQQ